jgi:hypothetical protein
LPPNHNEFHSTTSILPLIHHGYVLYSSLTSSPQLTPDYQNRAGANKSGAGVAGASESAVDRRERLRKLAMETIDLAKDPYILR